MSVARRAETASALLGVTRTRPSEHLHARHALVGSTTQAGGSGLNRVGADGIAAIGNDACLRLATVRAAGRLVDCRRKQRQLAHDWV